MATINIKKYRLIKWSFWCYLKEQGGMRIQNCVEAFETVYRIRFVQVAFETVYRIRIT
jgi:hypothetical protein